METCTVPVECGACRRVVHGDTIVEQPCCRLRVCPACLAAAGGGCPICHHHSLRARTKLHDYAATGDHRKVRKHLARGLLVDKRDERGWAPLHFAAKGGHVRCVELLLAAHANPDTADDSGWTPLMEAAWADSTVCTVLLLDDERLTVNKQDKDGWTAMHAAAFKGHHGCTVALLDAGASGTHADCGGQTPAMLATQCRHVELSVLLDPVQRHTAGALQQHQGISIREVPSQGSPLEPEPELQPHSNPPADSVSRVPRPPAALPRAPTLTKPSKDASAARRPRRAFVRSAEPHLAGNHASTSLGMAPVQVRVADLPHLSRSGPLQGAMVEGAKQMLHKVVVGGAAVVELALGDTDVAAAAAPSTEADDIEAGGTGGGDNLDSAQPDRVILAQGEGLPHGGLDDSGSVSSHGNLEESVSSISCVRSHSSPILQLCERRFSIVWLVQVGFRA
jgi:ankyrin repeat protein